MKFRPNQIYHVYNQGNNREPIFFEEENYDYFLFKVQRYILPYADVLCYCLMPNHFHFLLVPNKEAALPGTAVKPQLKWREKRVQDTSAIPTVPEVRQEKLSQAIGILLSSYTKAINKRLQRSGSLFRGKTKVKDGAVDGVLTLENSNDRLFFGWDNTYAIRCFKYIHQNPVKANLVSRAIDWPYSSAAAYAGLREDRICNVEWAKSSMFLAS